MYAVALLLSLFQQVRDAEISCNWPAAQRLTADCPAPPAACGEQAARLPVKPPVTLALVAANVYVHLAQSFPSLSAVCLQPLQIVHALANGRLLLERLLLSGFVHGDDMHLCVLRVSRWRAASLLRRL